MKKKSWNLVFLTPLVILVLAGAAVANFWTAEEESREIRLRQVKEGVSVADKKMGGLDQIEATKKLIELSSERKQEPKFAFCFEGEVVPAQKGRRIDLTETIKKVLTAEEEEEIKPVYTPLQPAIREKEVKEEILFSLSSGKKGKTIGHYTTYLENNEPGRRTNIKLAAEEANDYLLKPGKRFSFEELIGTPRERKGYKSAPVIEEGEYITRIGGGICQVSSTLYNAVLEAGLEPEEHHHHSRKVGYVPEGRDATFYPGEKDFQFRNGFSSPLLIKAQVIDRYLAIYLIKLVDE